VFGLGLSFNKSGLDLDRKNDSPFISASLLSGIVCILEIRDRGTTMIRNALWQQCQLNWGDCEQFLCGDVFV